MEKPGEMQWQQGSHGAARKQRSRKERKRMRVMSLHSSSIIDGIEEEDAKRLSSFGFYLGLISRQPSPFQSSSSDSPKKSIIGNADKEPKILDDRSTIDGRRRASCVFSTPPNLVAIRKLDELNEFTFLMAE
ncbi:hypothetical protein CRG98_040047 [Punica granatum]|uniref:Uncharacterized protein n=1 Tax=Punica granatum TaxID=22663 RepID=A0A2I0I6H1_PUNGR|nr:hypothetical protein CRG98_040047 [Punica granatum]